jgi:hypothetical protein
MDFLADLQNKLGGIFSIKLISEEIFLIEKEDVNFAILYYLRGAKREPTIKLTKTQIIHIDEDLWKSKPTILLNRISTIFGNAKRSYAREAVVARIDKKMAMEFQEEHHLQGAVSGKYRYGLFKDGELLAVAVFSGLRNMHHTKNYRSIELIHFCQKDRHLVIGGLSKLLATMIRDFYPNDIMTYIDKDWSDGEKFEALGFKIISNTKPHSFKIDKKTYKREIIKELKDIHLNNNQYLVSNLGSIKMVKFIH